MRTAIRQASLPGYELGDYIQEAMDFLSANEPPEGYFVGFSGGKDSIVTLELCRMARVGRVGVYRDNTSSLPISIRRRLWPPRLRHMSFHHG